MGESAASKGIDISIQKYAANLEVQIDLVSYRPIADFQHG